MSTQIPYDLICKAVRQACLSFQDSRKRWQALCLSGATDDQILEQITKEFYLGGGAANDLGIENHKGGSNPQVTFHLWGNAEDEVRISGKRLIDMVRAIFEIPDENKALQLCLFDISQDRERNNAQPETVG